MNGRIKSALRCVVASVLLTLVCPKPLLAELLPQEARQALLKGDWAAVLSVLETSGIKDADVPCRMVAAHAFLATNHNNEALVLFLAAEQPELAEYKKWTNSLLEANPDNAVILYLHGDAWARNGDLVSAERCFTQAIEANGRFSLAWMVRGVTRASLERFDEAYLDLRRACEIEPNLAEAHASMGCLETLLCNAEGACAAFNEALKINPEFALAYNGRGCARYGLGQPDAASLDFEMARTLCPVLAVAEANRGFVLAMVARQVDKHTRPAEKPGTTLETRSGLVPRVLGSPLLTSDGLKASFDERGFDSVYRELRSMRQEVVSQCLEVNRWLQTESGPGIDRLNQGIMAIEVTKSGIRVGKMLGILATGNLPAYFGQGALYLGKDAVNAKLDSLPPVDREVAKTLISGITIKPDAPFDVPGAFLEANLLAAKGAMELGIDLYAQQSTAKLQSIVGSPLAVRKIDDSCQRLVAMEIARDPDAFQATMEREMQALAGFRYSSQQPWSQMPELLNGILSGPVTRGPVMIVGQDPMKSFAFERMLDNRGIDSVVTTTVNAEDLSRLGSVLRPSAMVGFERDLDDSYRKLVPFLKPPDDFGGAGIGPSIPIVRGADTFSFPGAGGEVVTLPMPSGLDTPSGTWDSFKPWTPSGDAGGVRTQDLEWVFVDKGNWPVMTFFTLAYTPAQPAASQPAKEREKPD